MTVAPDAELPTVNAPTRVPSVRISASPFVPIVVAVPQIMGAAWTLAKDARTMQARAAVQAMCVVFVFIGVFVVGVFAGSEIPEKGCDHF